MLAIAALLAGIVARVSAAPREHWTEDEFSEARDDGMYAPGGDLNGDPEIAERVTPRIPVREIVAAAYRAAGLGDRPMTGWRVRSRLVGLVPQLSIHVGQGQSWRAVEDPIPGYREGWDVRATWHIDRLLFDPNEMRIATIDVDRRRERRRVAAVAIRAYFRWLVADEAARRAGSDAPRWMTRRDQRLAELDVLTDGWAGSALGSVAKPGG
jgi:hypothetical protein